MPACAPASPVNNLGKRLVIGINSTNLLLKLLVPNIPSVAIADPIPMNASKPNNQPCGCSLSRTTAKKAPNPRTSPLTFGKLKLISLLAQRLTRTMTIIKSSGPFSGVLGSMGARFLDAGWAFAASPLWLTLLVNQCSKKSPGTISKKALRFGEGNSRNGAASTSQSQCKRSRTIRMRLGRRSVLLNLPGIRLHRRQRLGFQKFQILIFDQKNNCQ